MVAALQGPQTPQAQAIQAMFAQPTSQLQKMAGDVVRPPLSTFSKPAGMTFSDWYDRMLSPGGASAIRQLPQPPANVWPISPAVGQMMGR